ncbi:MAG: aminotransferase class V-fold PLP-dependent enzyme [Lachnospiraceae bacterium]|nr:aminotransferase class V-fold PLP-dependent enzyme [Lachnospiraceae bacterium]
MKTPIRDFLTEYALSDTVRFHMPGHKGRIPGYEEDITEIQGADSLYEASGIIAESELNASGLFGTAATFYSAEGSSQCIRAMLALACKWGNACKGNMILAARNAHHAFITAAALLGLEVEWLYPEDTEYSLCSCRVSAAQVREKISSMKVKPAAVYLTSPDYLGGMQDIRSISEAVHEFDIPLLVDNAHGAYLHFLEPAIHPIDLGADMCCDSAHKTLPALTGCAYLHVSSEAADKDTYINYAKKALALFGSTSPSYMLLRSLDETNAVLAGTFREDLKKCCEAVRKCTQRLNCQGWTLHGEEPLKITVDAAAAGFEGGKLADILRQSGIECEYADPDYVVLMLSPYNDSKDYERLVSAMDKVSDSISKCSKSALPGMKPEKVLTIREAMFSASEIISSDSAAGRVLADTDLSCPPAVPLLVCGERIPEGAAELFAHYGITQVAVVCEL